MLNTIAMLVRARKKGRYVPAFNIYNLETIQAALESSCRAESPVILAFGERYLSYASFEVIEPRTPLSCGAAFGSLPEFGKYVSGIEGRFYLCYV